MKKACAIPTLLALVLAIGCGKPRIDSRTDIRGPVGAGGLSSAPLSVSLMLFQVNKKVESARAPQANQALAGRFTPRCAGFAPSVLTVELGEIHESKKRNSGGRKRG